MDLIYLNQIAQGINSIEDGVIALEKLPEKMRLKTLHSLHVMLTQAHPTEEEVEPAIEKAALTCYSPPWTPSYDEDIFGNILFENFRKEEQVKFFRYGMALFQIADARRKITQCKNSCTHWWHQSLVEENK